RRYGSTGARRQLRTAGHDRRSDSGSRCARQRPRSGYRPLRPWALGAVPRFRGTTKRKRARALGSCDGLQLAQRRKPCQRLAFQLAHAFAREVELVPDRLERPGLALEAEPKLENAALALWKRIQSTPHTLAPQRLLRFVERIRSLAICKEIAELALVVCAHGLVQGHGRVRGTERLVDVLHRQAGRLPELILGRLTAELDLQPACCAAELLLAVDNVDGHTDGARMVRDCALHRLADPPRRVGRELVPPAPVELLDGAVEPEGALLDQIEEGDTEPAVTLGDRNHESQV